MKMESNNEWLKKIIKGPKRCCFDDIININNPDCKFLSCHVRVLV